MGSRKAVKEVAKPSHEEIVVLMHRISEVCRRQRDTRLKWELGDGEHPERHIFRRDKLILDVAARGMPIEVHGFFDGIPVNITLMTGDQYLPFEHTCNQKLFDTIKGMIDEALEEVK